MRPVNAVVTGCRAALVNVEAQPVSALSFLRKCVVAKMKDLTIDRFKDAVLQNAGGLLVILPSNLSQLSNSEKEVYACCFCPVKPWLL